MFSKHFTWFGYKYLGQLDIFCEWGVFKSKCILKSAGFTCHSSLFASPLDSL